jgi:GNAT superfamily N-acetyltransferase
MEWGMKNRLAQLIKPDGHCLFLPIDHGYFQGPTRKLEKPGETIRPLLRYCDAIFVTRGVLRSSVDPENTKPIILRVSGGTSMVGKDLSDEGLTTSMEEAIRLGADAVSVHVNVGAQEEDKMLATLGIMIGDRAYWGRGYGRDAVRVLLSYAFHYLGARRIVLTTHARNERALRCYRACGFVEEGRPRAPPEDGRQGRSRRSAVKVDLAGLEGRLQEVPLPPREAARRRSRRSPRAIPFLS